MRMRLRMRMRLWLWLWLGLGLWLCACPHHLPPSTTSHPPHHLPPTSPPPPNSSPPTQLTTSHPPRRMHTCMHIYIHRLGPSHVAVALEPCLKPLPPLAIQGDLLTGSLLRATISADRFRVGDCLAQNRANAVEWIVWRRHACAADAGIVIQRSRVVMGSAARIANGAGGNGAGSSSHTTTPARLGTCTHTCMRACAHACTHAYTK